MLLKLCRRQTIKVFSLEIFELKILIVGNIKSYRIPLFGKNYSGYTVVLSIYMNSYVPMDLLRFIFLPAYEIECYTGFFWMSRKKTEKS